MSYHAQDQLLWDPTFQARNRSVAVEQANVFKDSALPNYVALANDCLRGDESKLLTFTRIAAGSPGIADKTDNGDGTIDQSKVTDGDLLSLTQGNWQVVASLYFNDDGSPIE